MKKYCLHILAVGTENFNKIADGMLENLEEGWKLENVASDKGVFLYLLSKEN